jgi:hypothetical protein
VTSLLDLLERRLPPPLPGIPGREKKRREREREREREITGSA